MARDFILRDTTHASWPGCLAYRDETSKPSTGYQSYSEAMRRMRAVTEHYNTHYGRAPGDLRIVERVVRVTRWTCWGEECGGCGQSHRTENAAKRCCQKYLAFRRVRPQLANRSDRTIGTVTRDTLDEIHQALLCSSDPRDKETNHV